MKKILSILTVGLISTGIFLSTNNNSSDYINDSVNIHSTQKSKKESGGGIYVLSPGETVERTDDHKFDDYWTQIVSEETGESANQLFILKGVTKEEHSDKYVLDMLYSWNGLAALSTDSNVKYRLTLNIKNEAGETISDYTTGNLIDPQNDYGLIDIQPEIPVSEVDGKIYINTNLGENGSTGEIIWSNNTDGDNSLPEIDIDNFVKGFGVSNFEIFEDSIMPTEFKFSVEITPRNGDEFDPLENSLVLYSNKVALNTSLAEEKTTTRAIEYTYNVTDLKENHTYGDWAIGLSGFENIENITYREIKTSRENPNEAGVISGISIGIIILILLIILIILLALRSRKKVIENNVYHEYRSFLDENGNVITMTQEEYEKLSRKEAKKLTEIENTDLLDGYYEFHSNSDDERYLP